MVSTKDYLFSITCYFLKTTLYVSFPSKFNFLKESCIPSFQHNTKTFSNKTRRLSSLPIFPLFPVPIPILSINNINNTSSCLLIYFSLFPSCFTFQHLIRDDPLSLQIFFQGKVWIFWSVREFFDYHVRNFPPILFFVRYFCYIHAYPRYLAT